MSDPLPNTFKKFRERYPDVAAAYEKLGDAAYSAGPLSEREARLVKLALAMGAGQEGGVHSQTRRAIRQGMTAEELRQVAILAITTLGLSASMRGMSWIDDLLEKD